MCVRKLFEQTNQKSRKLPKSLLRGCVPKVRFGDDLCMQIEILEWPHGYYNKLNMYSKCLHNNMSILMFK